MRIVDWPVLALALACSMPAHAQPEAAAPAAADETTIAAARAAGIVGEQADGYLGFVKPPTPEIKSAVEAANAKRRDTYTDIAAKPGSLATVQEVAAARGCERLASRVAPGELYRLTPAEPWQTRGPGPVKLDPVCG